MSARGRVGQFGEVQNLQAGGLGVEHEAHQCGDAVEALPPSGAGVDVQEVVLFVVHDLQYVAVSADEDVGPCQAEGALQEGGIVAGPAADVHHQHALPLAEEEGLLVELVVQGEAVAVAVDGPDGLEGAELVEYAGSEVAGMPQLVAVLEEGVDLRRDGAVGVGEYADSFHGCNGCSTAETIMFNGELCEAAQYILKRIVLIPDGGDYHV